MHMEGLGAPKVLMDERMGRIDGSVSARCSHVSDGVRLRPLEGLGRNWYEVSDAWLAMRPRSSVAVLDVLQRARAA
ncbi:hypothetical protein ACX6XY_11265 [Streptomyces sp. O3]